MNKIDQLDVGFLKGETLTFKSSHGGTLSADNINAGRLYINNEDVDFKIKNIYSDLDILILFLISKGILENREEFEEFKLSLKLMDNLIDTKKE